MYSLCLQVLYLCECECVCCSYPNSEKQTIQQPVFAWCVHYSSAVKDLQNFRIAVLVTLHNIFCPKMMSCWHWAAQTVSVLITRLFQLERFVTGANGRDIHTKQSMFVYLHKLPRPSFPVVLTLDTFHVSFNRLSTLLRCCNYKCVLVFTMIKHVCSVWGTTPICKRRSHMCFRRNFLTQNKILGALEGLECACVSV